MDLTPGLKRRKREFIEPLNLKRSEEFHGWTSDIVDDLDSEVRDSIIKHADAAIKTKRPVPAAKTRSEGYVMLGVVDGTPPESHSVFGLM
jgi:hypothetical protein